MSVHLRRSLFVTFLLTLCLLAGSTLTGSALAATNYAVVLDGQDYLTTPSTDALNPTTAITVEVWCMIPGPFSDRGNSPLIEKPYYSHSSPWYQYHLGINSGSQEFLFDLAIENSRQLLRSPLGVLPFGEWVHVAGTYDGAMMRIFVNGTEVSQRAMSGALSTFDADLIVGHFANLTTGIVGAIDAVRVWDVAHSPEQIRAMMCANLSGSEEGLVAAWNFDEGMGASAADISSYGHDLTHGREEGANVSDLVWQETEDHLCPGAVEVSIDVMPDTERNPVNCTRQTGLIPVAILTTDDFDATTVDHTTVRFGPGETAESHRNRHGVKRHEEDVDGDGDLDLVFHFQMGETGIQCGDTEVMLSGETFGGEMFTGTDAILTTKPRDSAMSKVKSILVTPNPFNPATAVSFTLDETYQVQVSVYNVRGVRVADLADRQYSAGVHSVRWMGRDSAGQSVPSGQYFFRIEAGGEVQFKKALLLK